jgi:hypothetical protein
VNAGAYSCRRSNRSAQIAVSSPLTMDVRRRLPSQSVPNRACSASEAWRRRLPVARDLKHAEGLIHIRQLGGVGARPYGDGGYGDAFQYLSKSAKEKAVVKQLVNIRRGLNGVY